MIEITEEQVDKVREEADNSVSDHEAGGLYLALELLNINDCKDCGGVGKRGHLRDSENSYGPCKSCNGRGWVHNAK